MASLMLVGYYLIQVLGWYMLVVLLLEMTIKAIKFKRATAIDFIDNVYGDEIEIHKRLRQFIAQYFANPNVNKISLYNLLIVKARIKELLNARAL